MGEMRRRHGEDTSAPKSDNEKDESEQKSRKKKSKSSGDEAVKVVRIGAIGWICCGFIIGSIFGGSWTDDLVNWVRGYRWNYLDRCIMETPDTSGYGVDFCRTPTDCSFCSDIKEIETIHVDKINEDMFENRFAYSGRPLVVRNATLDWKAMDQLNYYWLKDAYLSDPEIFDKEWDDCWFNRYKTEEFRNLRSVFKLPDWRIEQDVGEPWYVGWSVCQKPVAEMLFELFDRPTFISPDSTPPKKPWIFIGTPGYGAHSHVDNVGEPTWQAQIRGVKTWYLDPPPECRWTCHGRMEVTMYPGDIIVLDTNRWFHATLVQGEELSVVITNEYD